MKDKMDLYLIIKTIHIISSTVLFGTGMGIAFFMFRSHFTDHVNEKYYAIKNAVLADFIFTTPAVFIQPLTGFWLIWRLGYDWHANWLLMSYYLFILVGCFWLPVVAIQIKLRNILKKSLDDNSPLPKNYSQLFKLWLALGVPAFISVIAIFYLMVAKPI